MVVFAELPGSGKSTLARGVADAIGATCLRIDTIESAIVSTLMPYRDNPVGYVVAERIAADQLDAGRDVVADAVNGVAAAWAGWVMLAARTGRRCGSWRCGAVMSPSIAAGWGARAGAVRAARGRQHRRRGPARRAHCHRAIAVERDRRDGSA